MSRSRLVPLALAVTLLLAVVALVARGRPLGSSGGSGGGLPLGFWDYAYTTIVIVAVPLLLAGVVVAALIRRREGKKRPYWESLLRGLVLYAIFLGLELLLVRHVHLRLAHLQPHPPRQLLKPGSGPQHRHQGSGAPRQSLRFRWDELAIVLGLLLVVGVAVLVALRRSRPERRTRLETAPESLAAALDESLDDLRADPDLRRAIVAAYARMERALAAAGIPRHPAEAPLEYLERALLGLDTSADAVRRLTDLFEWARFSHHEPEPSMRDDAVDALIAVRDELRASELVPA
ncbi:MAG: DUF4129 domain-containing protein [Gaiellaceae bacterium]